MSFTFRRHKKLHKQAYAAFDSGELAQAAAYFAELVKRFPDDSAYHYMQGLTAKNRMDWPTALHANLRAIECADGFAEGAHWNAAIAATALHDWDTARRMWAACGIAIPEGEDEIRADFGIAVIRLNPWADGETVYARRIDPVRAQIINVPLPESGWRFGDIALHDGAPTGTRPDGQGGEVSVFNAFERWRPSETPTHTAFARCPAAADAEALTGLLEQHGWTAEDWTHSLRYICLRCSYGIPHEHTDAAPSVEQADTWQTERSIGIAAPAAQSAELETALQNWAAAALGREVSDICRQDYPLPARQDGRVWWIGSSE